MPTRNDRMLPIIAIVRTAWLVRFILLGACAYWTLKVGRGDPSGWEYWIYFCLLAAFLAVPAFLVSTLSLPLARINPSLARRSVLAFETLFSTWLGMDAYFYANFGVRIIDPVVIRAFALRDTNFGFRLGPEHGLLLIGVVAAGWLVHSKAASFSLRRRQGRNEEPGCRQIAALAALALIGITVNVGFRNRLTRFENPIEAIPLYSTAGVFILDGPDVSALYPTEGYRWQMDRKPDILFVFSDSLRYDAFAQAGSETTMKLGLKTGCATSERHYPGSHMTHAGVFAALFGLDSYYFHTFNQARIRSVPLDILRQNGYRLAVYDSAGIASYAPPIVPASEFDVYRHLATATDRAVSDRQAIDEVLQELDRPDRKQPLFAFVFLFSTHSPYFMDAAREASLKNKSDLKSRYLKSAEYVDAQLARLLESQRKRIRSHDAVVVISGDHGESLGERGQWGHVALGRGDEATRVPLLFCGAPEASADVRLSTHADLWPSIFRLLGGTEPGTGASHPGAPSSPRWLSGIPVFAGAKREQALLSEAYFPNVQTGLALVEKDRRILFRVKKESFDEFRVGEIIGRDGTVSGASEATQHLLEDAMAKQRGSYCSYFARKDRAIANRSRF